MPRKLVLICDTDRQVVKELGNAFHQREYDVRAARDGSRALEKTILIHPDIVLFDLHSPFLSARKFVQILRSNPRTEQIPVIVMCARDDEDPSIWGYREAIIRKPFNTDEVLSLVAAILRRLAAAQAVNEVDKQVTGQLGPVGLADLLQIFHVNNKTGSLHLQAPDGTEGLLVLREGRLVHASLGPHRGEKALFRLLGWEKGRFSFVPDQIGDEVSIRRGTDLLLLESARQTDELARLKDDLPGPQMRLVVVPGMQSRFDGLHPVTQEILSLLAFYNTIGDLIEHSRVPDFEACRGIRTLLDKGVLCVQDDLVSPAGRLEPLLPADLMYDLMVRLSNRHGRSSRTTRGKVCLLCSGEESRIGLARNLAALPGFEPVENDRGARLGFGYLGALRLSENLALDFELLPTQRHLEPLWAPLGVGLDAILICSGVEKDRVIYRLNKMVRRLVHDTRVPVVRADASDQTNRRYEADDPMQFRRIVVHLLHQLIGWSLDCPAD